jgi:peptidoglycan/LPS O-acetylase OafA/YrhL
MEYRKEIDGLRAIAVISVILYHAGFSVFKGGFIGVDVFFVISGFLITTLINKSIIQNNFFFTNFLIKRARRLLPALFFVLFCCIPLSWLLLSINELKNFSESLSWVSVYISNFYFWRSGGYFESAFELKPLIHTWSLSVEEQFYILFPILLVFLYRFSKKNIFLCYSTFFLISLIIAQYASHYYPKPNYFLMPSRAWEFIAGSLLTVNSNISFKKIYSKIYSNIISFVGLALLLISIFFFNKLIPYPSVYTLIPVLGTVLVLEFSKPYTIVYKILCSPILVHIGLISYSAYLWHQPLMAFLKYIIHPLELIHILFLLVLLYFLSYFTYLYIESPFRLSSYLSNKKFILLFSILSFFIISYGLLIRKGNFNLEDEMSKELLTSEMIFSANINEPLFIKKRIQYETLAPNTIILGSSRVMQIGNHLEINNVGINQVLNLGVSGSSIEDIISVGMLAIDKFNPSTIIIGLDPWIYNAFSQKEIKNYILKDDYEIALKKLNLLELSSKDEIVKEKEMFINCKFNFIEIYKNLNLNTFKVKSRGPELLHKIRRDGSLIYNLDYESRTNSEIEIRKSSYLNAYMSPYKYSNNAELLLHRFIEYVQKKNKKIILFLTPYHPSVYKLSLLDRNLLNITESKFKSMAKEKNVQIVGSYNPNLCGCIAYDFYDGIHPKDNCIELILKQMKLQKY